MLLIQKILLNKNSQMMLNIEKHIIGLKVMGKLSLVKKKVLSLVNISKLLLDEQILLKIRLLLNLKL